tara:strand:+ start:426 stop:632 length:207 start_codon:yes stop_codon:yes gene_type:complete
MTVKFKGFKDVFVEKLRKQKHMIKEELKRPSSERRKEWLKRQLQDTRRLKKLVEELSEERCPHCGEKL